MFQLVLNRTRPAPGDVVALAGPMRESDRAHLRAVLETACFGASHAPSWVALGFAAAAGAHAVHAVHADSWTSFPAFLDHWEAGYTFAETVEAANRALGSVDTDRLVSPMFPEADSQKVIVGAGTFDVSMPGR